MAQLLIATNNAHKLIEYQEIFADLLVTVTSLANQGITLDPEETGVTFEDNAILKAKAFARASGLPTLADDSGLEIDALNGEPGVYSARYGNTAKDDHVGRYQIVLNKLKGVPRAQRTAIPISALKTIRCAFGMIRVSSGSSPTRSSKRLPPRRQPLEELTQPGLCTGRRTRRPCLCVIPSRDG